MATSIQTHLDKFSDGGINNDNANVQIFRHGLLREDAQATASAVRATLIGREEKRGVFLVYLSLSICQHKQYQKH